MRSLRQAGGEVVKEIYAPLNTADFAPYLAKVGGLGADAVYAWFAGADAIRFVKAYKECGLAGKLPLLGYNTLTDDTILPAIGDAALGIVTVGHYSATLDAPDNRPFARETRPGITRCPLGTARTAMWWRSSSLPPLTRCDEGRARRVPARQYHRGTHPQHLPGGNLEVVEQVGP